MTLRPITWILPLALVSWAVGQKPRSELSDDCEVTPAPIPEFTYAWRPARMTHPGHPDPRAFYWFLASTSFPSGRVFDDRHFSRARGGLVATLDCPAAGVGTERPHDRGRGYRGQADQDRTMVDV